MSIKQAFTEIIDTISNKENTEFSLLCHKNADPDSLCSAYALEALIKKINRTANTEIILPEGPNKTSEKIIENLKIIAKTKQSLSNPTVIFVLDSGSVEQLGELNEFIHQSPSFKIFIDHHMKDNQISEISNTYLADSSAAACSEIIYRLFETCKIIPEKKIALALLIGITFDSAFFSLGTATTFRIVSELLELGISVAEIKQILSKETSIPEKIARLKSSKRMKINIIDKWILASSRVGSFQASAARALLSLGADFSVVAGKTKTGFKASMRAKEIFCKATEIHLGNLANELTQEFEGSGNGHLTAAGINAKGDVSEFLETVVKIIQGRI